MQQRRIPIPLGQRTALAPREVTTSDEVARAARVSVLGGCVGRHLTEEHDDSLPAASGAFNVRSIGHDLRASPEAPQQNALLASLDAMSYARLRPQLEWVSLPHGRVVCEAGVKPSHVYFPTSGIVSLSCELENGTAVEVALTGNEGLVGVQVLMGGSAATSRAVVRSAGFGYRLPAEALKGELEACPPLRQSLLPYAQALMTQVTRTAVCHCHHQLEQQFSRVLLLSLDRLPSNELALTQEAMANLLGVRRESITVTAGRLQAAGLIRYHRGHVTVQDRRGLEARACECYAVVRAALEAPLPQPGDRQEGMSISRRYVQLHAGSR